MSFQTYRDRQTGDTFTAFAFARRLRGATSVVGALAGLLCLPACSSDGGDGNGPSGGGGSGNDGGSAGSGGGGGGSSSFDQCVADLPLCKIAEKDTAEKIQEPCGVTEFIPIPLADGTTHGPAVIEATDRSQGVVIDWNAGAGTEFENPINPSEAGCDSVIDGFGEPEPLTDDLKNLRGMDQALYTIFRPACMREGETYPVITWANGTCGYTHGYAVLLGAVASHGYVVIASNSTYTGQAPTDTVQLRALDFAEAINDDPDSPLYQRLDLENIGAMGHSQGALATISSASDPRVDAVIAWNTGTSNEKPFLNVSAEGDIGALTPELMQQGVDAAAQPGAWVYHHQVLNTGGNLTGHLVLMEQPERVWEMTVAWWDWHLKGSDEGKAMFVGDGCGLCNMPGELSYGQNDLLE